MDSCIVEDAVGVVLFDRDFMLITNYKCFRLCFTVPVNATLISLYTLIRREWMNSSHS